MEDKLYDLIIIGASAAATSAGVYAARRGLDFKIISKDFGGEVATSGEIGNWPGIIQTDGISLALQFKAHLEANHVTIEEGIEVSSISKQGNEFSIKAKDGSYRAKAVIVATGAHPRELTVDGEREFRNKGVSYCTVCDGPLFNGKITAVVGGGNSALEAALMLADISSKVYVINKNAQFKGEQILIDNLALKKNVDIIYEAMTQRIIGDKLAKGIIYKDKSGQEHTLDAEGIFVHIGSIPNSAMVPTEVVKDQFGYIKVNANCETSVAGLLAAGDVTDVPFKQIVIAAGQGTIALLSAVSYLNRLDHAT